MTFAAGVVAGIVATALVALLVFKARVIAGSAGMRLPDLRMVIAVAALVVAIAALVRSGDRVASPSTGTTADTENDLPSTSPAPPPSSTTSTVLTSITVPNVIGLSESNAKSQMERVGLRTQIRRLPLGNVVPGFVVQQTPTAFSTTSSGAVVVLGVSSAA